MKKISIASPCYNEVGNLREFYSRCKMVLAKFPQYDYEFVVEDNYSTDGSRELLRELAAADRNFKVIFNSRNFGHVRSPYNVLLQATGDAVIWMCCDLQESPETIEQFVQEWEKGAKIVAAVRDGTKASIVLESFRRCYYWLLAKFSPGETVIPKFTGFGLYDKVAIEAFKKYDEPYPYFRGLVCEVGFRRVTVPYVQEARKSGKTSNNFISLYDQAMNGFVNHTKLPLRLAAFTGFALAALSLLTAAVYFIYKLLFWNSFSVGVAPLVIGIFFFSSVQLIFIGIIGEYIGAIWTQVKHKPLVIEEERINFKEEDGK